MYYLGGALDGSDVLIGAKADMHRGALLLSHPIEHGTYHHYGHHHHPNHYHHSTHFPTFLHFLFDHSALLSHNIEHGDYPLLFTIHLLIHSMSALFITHCFFPPIHLSSSPLTSSPSNSSLHSILHLLFPPLSGIVQSWSDMERLWSHVYAKENLNVPSEDHPVLLTGILYTSCYQF